MKKEPKELTRENCPNTRRISFWSKCDLVESEHLRVQHYKSLNDADKAKLIMSERVIN